MKKMLLFSLLLVFASSACFVEMKAPPVYQGKEGKVKIEGGEEYKEIARKASENFEKIYNEGKIDSLFDLIDDQSQLKSDRVYWDVRFNRIKSELGKQEKSEYRRANVFQKSKTVEVRIEYQTKFEKDDGTKPRYVLYFWEIYNDGEARLLNYMNGIDNEKSY